VKFFFDNNLSPHLAHAIHELCKGEGKGIVVEHLSDRFPRNCPDPEWITTLAEEGGWSVLSQDRFRKSDLEREALRRSGLIVFALDKSWATAPHWNKAQNLVRWWPSILSQAALFRGGAAVRVPWRISGAGKFQQIRI
jgi:hypothetical protein